MSMPIKNNRIVTDLNKCQFAHFYWRNQFGDKSSVKLKYSYRGKAYDPNAKAFMKGGKTLEEVALALDIKDRWNAELKLQLTANHSVIYTGKKAISIYREWNKRIFKN